MRRFGSVGSARRGTPEPLAGVAVRLAVTRLLVLLGPTAALGAGCVGIATPRLPDDVASAIAQHRMRRLETDDMVLYYPEGRKEHALRFLDRVEGCAAYEKGMARLHNGVADQKMLVVLPELPFNNAFVAPRLAGYGAIAVVPTFNTIDLFMLESGLPPDPAIIGCHEITHYVHLEQIAGFARFLNVFGEVYTPQIGLDPWFDEGLAVFYETKLQPGVGRLSWPFWHGTFAAGVAGRRLNGGDLSAFNRDFFGGNHYLIGSEFVGFLAGRYGEEKLWDLIAAEGRSIFFPLWVNLRFWQAYDKTLSTLIDEFADDVALRDPVTPRPPEQRMVRPVGESARYARALDGTEAFITEDRDRPSRLVIVSPDGQVRVERDLVDVVPPRDLKISSPSISGGLSFTADASSLFFVALDQGATYQATRLVRYDVASGALTVVVEDLHGVGGSISPDGRRYVFPRAEGDHHDLVELDLARGALRLLAAEPPGAFVAAPRFSPDGARIAATVFDGARFAIAVFDAATGAKLATLPTGNAPVHEAAWADDRRLVYLGTSRDDWRFQVFLHDLADHSTVQITHAPYLAFEPQAAGGRTVRFLNREGWAWTLDEVALPAPRELGAPLAAQPSESEAPAEPAPAPEPAPVPVPAAEALAAPSLRPPVSAGPPPASVLATDRPASAFDGLFVPKLYGPTVAAVGRRALLLGAVLSGNDRLELHRFTVSGYYQVESGLPGVSLGYANRQLAPFTFELSAAQFSVHDLPPRIVGQPAPTELSLYRRDREALADVTRSFYGNPVGLGFAFIESYRPDDLAVARFPLQRFAGPYVFASYSGSESTAYTGARRLLDLSLYAAAFPRDFTTAASGFVDVSASAFVFVPLPLLRRHRLALDVRGRDLAGLPDSDPLLQVGGSPAGTLWRHANRDEPEALGLPPLSPAQMPFVEGLRGFEDHPIAVNRIFIVDATYRYPFIIDWGSASTFAVLPAFFFKQLDLRLFGTGATTLRGSDRHLAAGSSLTALFAVWQLSFSLEYQIARRLTDDHGLVQLLVLGV